MVWNIGIKIIQVKYNSNRYRKQITNYNGNTDMEYKEKELNYHYKQRRKETNRCFDGALMDDKFGDFDNKDLNIVDFNADGDNGGGFGGDWNTHFDELLFAHDNESKNENANANVNDTKSQQTQNVDDLFTTNFGNEIDIFNAMAMDTVKGDDNININSDVNHGGAAGLFDDEWDEQEITFPEFDAYNTETKTKTKPKTDETQQEPPSQLQPPPHSNQIPPVPKPAISFDTPSDDNKTKNEFMEINEHNPFAHTNAINSLPNTPQPVSSMNTNNHESVRSLTQSRPALASTPSNWHNTTWHDTNLEENALDRDREIKRSDLAPNKNESLNEKDVVVSQINPTKSIQDKLLQSIQQRINTMPFVDSVSQDESENESNNESENESEEDRWMAMYPNGNNNQNYRNPPTQQKDGKKDESNDNHYNNDDNNDQSDGSGRDSSGSGSGSGSNGSNEDDGDDDDEKESKRNPQTENDGDPTEEDELETDRFIHFLMNGIEKCENDVKLREAIHSFSDRCMEKVFAGIQQVYNMKTQLSKIRQSIKKKEKKQKKSRPKRNSANTHIHSFNPFQMQKIKSQYRMDPSFTAVEIPSKVIEMSAIDSDLNVGCITYDGVIKSLILAIHKDNYYTHPDEKLQIFNCGLHSKQSNQATYFIANRLCIEQKRFMVDAILTKNEISAKYRNIALNELPNPNRIDTSHEMKEVEHEIMQMVHAIRGNANGNKRSNILEDTKWTKVHIYNETNNKRRMELKYNSREFRAHCQAFITSTDEEEMTLFPIMMFDHTNKLCLQFVWIVSLEENVDIGIAFGCLKPVTVVGIHLNKGLMYKQHQILCTSQPCQHLSHFKSCINYMRIGNCDAELNAKKALQQQLRISKERTQELERKLDDMCRDRSLSMDSSLDTDRSICSNSHAYGSSPISPNQSAFSPTSTASCDLTDEYHDTRSHQE